MSDTTVRSMRVDVEVCVRAAPERVYEALTAEVWAWWTYTFREPSTVVLEPWAGGRFYEAWDGEPAVLYASVTRAKPGVLLAMAGGMGMSGDVQGTIHLTLVGTRGGTQVALTHIASGELDEGAEEAYRQGWETLLVRCLKPFVETGAIPER